MKHLTLTQWLDLLRKWEREISIQRGALVYMVTARMNREILEKQARKCEAMSAGLTRVIDRGAIKF